MCPAATGFFLTAYRLVNYNLTDLFCG
uniref:Uncharacterized protein n=1 Tax=Anguilla anguilla TaxID=7936 RepID=A0A0E9VMT4_ANGAN